MTGKTVLLLVFATATLVGQDNPAAPVETPKAAVADSVETARTRHRLGLVATRAVAYFRSADSIEANLAEQGLSLSPEIAVLRSRLEGALDESDAALARNDLSAANEALSRAEGLVEKFAAKLGG